MLALLLLETENSRPFWHLLIDNVLALTVFVIFLAAAIGAVTRLRRKDKCLKLLHDHHVTFLARCGRALWGDLVVYSQGIELRFDAPHVTRQGLKKTSALLYQTELSQCFAICRLDLALTGAERRERVKQVRRSFRPGPGRRAVRGLRNVFNTLRDAIAQAIGALVDAFARKRGATGLSKKENPQLGETLIGARHAYDPMLERHVGKPVVLRVADPEREELAPFELPGYLVDYTDEYLAVFNVEHDAGRDETVPVEASLERADLAVEVSADEVRVKNPGKELLVVRTARIGERVHDLGVALLPGSVIELSRGGADPVELSLRWKQKFDVVCPREVGTVYFGSDSVCKERHPHDGLAPVQKDE